MIGRGLGCMKEAEIRVPQELVRMQQQLLTKRPNSLIEDYEFHVYEYDIPGGARDLPSRAITSSCEYGPCPVLVMSRHEGFQWNDELFVAPFRRSAGFKTCKSADRKLREERISKAISKIIPVQESPVAASSTQGSPLLVTDPLSAQQHFRHWHDQDRDQVIELSLTEADRDIWP